MSGPIHSLGLSLDEKDTNNDALASTNTNLNNETAVQDLSIRTSQPLPFQFDLSFLHKLDQLLPENPLFFMQQQHGQQQHMHDQPMDQGDSVSGNHPLNTIMSSFGQSASNNNEPHQSIWSGFNNFFSNVAHNPFPQSIPNLAKNVSEYLSNYQLFSSLNPQATNAQQSTAPTPGIKYEPLLDGTYTPVNMNSPRMQIRVLGVPQSGAKSRVETQTKLCLQLVTEDGDKAQQWTHLKLPDYMVAKDKLKKQPDTGVPEAKTNTMLFLRARVICASDPSRKVLTCLGCIQRERKRSQRRKENKIKTEPNEDEPSLTLDEQRILLFNCSEMVDFSSGDTILPTRITCYCRHHNERLGFCIYFEMQDHTGNTVATGMSPPIMITDDHKSSKLKSGRKRPRTDDVDTPIDTQAIFAAASSYSFGTSTPSIGIQNKNYNASNDTASTTSSSSSSSSNIHSFLPLGNSFTDPPPFNMTRNQSMPHHIANTNGIDKQYVELNHTPSMVTAPSIKSDTKHQQSLDDGTVVEQPQMQRMIPNEGPTDGGIEVTILGTGFRPGLTCMFGDVTATNTHYWSSNTLVCILPAALCAGAVTVSLRTSLGENQLQDHQPLFTYCNEGDGALMELALQVVGLKMTGKVEDARDIAMRIVDGNGNHVIASNHHHSSKAVAPSLAQSTQQQSSLAWRSLPSVEAIRQLLDDRASGQNKLCFDWPRMQMLESPGTWSD